MNKSGKECYCPRPLTPVDGESLQDLIRRRLPSTLNEHDEAKAIEILNEKWEYYFHPDFNRKAMNVILNKNIDTTEAEITWFKIFSGESFEANRINNVNSIILTREEEEILFKQYNYAKYMVVKHKTMASYRKLSVKETKNMIKWRNDAKLFENKIVVSNLGLVISTIRKRFEFKEELVQEGYCALLRSIKKFNPNIGIKFSTYACHSIFRGMVREIVKQSNISNKFPVSFEDLYYKDKSMLPYETASRNETLEHLHECLENNHAGLTEQEKSILIWRFGLYNNNTHTLKDIGNFVSLTKERVRQIQNRAIEKLSDVLGGNFNAKKEKRYDNCNTN